MTKSQHCSYTRGPEREKNDKVPTLQLYQGAGEKKPPVIPGARVTLQPVVEGFSPRRVCLSVGARALLVRRVRPRRGPLFFVSLCQGPGKG